MLDDILNSFIQHVQNLDLKFFSNLFRLLSILVIYQIQFLPIR